MRSLLLLLPPVPQRAPHDSGGGGGIDEINTISVKVNPQDIPGELKRLQVLEHNLFDAGRDEEARWVREQRVKLALREETSGDKAPPEAPRAPRALFSSAFTLDIDEQEDGSFLVTKRLRTSTGLDQEDTGRIPRLLAEIVLTPNVLGEGVGIAAAPASPFLNASLGIFDDEEA